jgi:hypothetical protein
MAVLSKGQTFATGDQVTALKLNDLVDDATFVAGAVDNASTQLSSGAIIVKDGGVTTAKLNDGAVTTAKIADSNVTTAKIADSNVTFAKLTDVIDDDTMATATDTTLATSESIKAYVDKLKPNVVQAIKTDTFEESNPNNAWIDIPDLSVSITPKFSNSKMFVQAMVSSSTNNGNFGVYFKLVRDTTDIGIGDAEGSRTRCSFTGGYSGTYSAASNGIDFLDTPSLVAGTPVTYKVQCTGEGTNDVYINRSNTNTNANEVPRPISTLTVTEVYQ